MEVDMEVDEEADNRMDKELPWWMKINVGG